MPLNGKTKQVVVSEFRCAEILDAARRVFARDGFNGATMDNIAEAAGLAKGTLYLYFQSKRDVYLAALKQGFAALNEETTRNLDAAPTASAKLRAFITTRVRYAEAHRDFIQIYYAQLGNVGPGALSEFRQLYLDQAKALTAVLAQAVEQSHIRPLRTDTAAVMIFEMTRALIMQRLLGWSTASLEEDVDCLLEMIWKGLAPNGNNGIGKTRHHSRKHGKSDQRSQVF